MSVTLDLVHLWLNRADDQSDYLRLDLVRFERKDTLGGEFRSYASGRVRWAETGEDATTYTAVLRQPSAELRAKLRARRGVIHIVRDPDGNRFAATFGEVDAAVTWRTWLELLPRTADGNVTLEFTAVTYAEAV